jgi:hypothetical protein
MSRSPDVFADVRALKRELDRFRTFDELRATRRAGHRPPIDARGRAVQN